LQYETCKKTVCPPPKIIGCQVSNSLIISTKNVQNVGSIIDSALNGGANQIEFISFVLSNTSIFEFQVLTEATQRAIKKANSVASTIGETIVSISSVQENQFSSSPSSSSKMEAPVTPTSIEVGLVQISATVTIEALSQQKHSKNV